MLHDFVCADDIGAVVSCQTGIPIIKLMSGEIEKLVNMKDTLRFSFRGQDEALTTVADLMGSRRAALSGHNRPDCFIPHACTHRCGENRIEQEARKLSLLQGLP